MKFLKRQTNKVFIVLGNQCNLNCKYCLQKPLIENQLYNIINNDIYDFLCETAYENKNHTLDICFYGGEPTLYFNNIKEIVLELEKRNTVNFNYGIITNGKAITDDMIFFFNKYNFNVTISWDGYNSLKTRGFDVFSDINKKNKILKLNNLCLSGVMSSYNYHLELLSAFNDIDKEYYKYHSYHLYVNIDDIFDTGLSNKELLNIDYSRVNYEINALLKILDLYVQDSNYYNSNDVLIIQYLNSIISKVTSNEQEKNRIITRCGNGITVLNIDLKGNLYPCHNVSKPIGTIYDNLYNIYNNVLKLDNTLEFMKKCNNCSVLSICKGGCKLINSDTRAKTYCKLKKSVYEPILKYIERVNNYVNNI